MSNRKLLTAIQHKDREKAFITIFVQFMYR